MRTQWEILLFILCLNLAIGMCFALGLPGTAYVAQQPDSTDYNSRFNADRIKQWGATPFQGIPVIGDIFGGFNFYISIFGFLIDGFPTLLTYIGNTMLTDSAAYTAFQVIANVIRVIYSALICAFLIEFISGRVHTD